MTDTQLPGQDNSASVDAIDDVQPKPVVIAFRLAWHMSEAFDGAKNHVKRPKQPDNAGAEEHLPGWSELTPEEQDGVLRAQILHDVQLLGLAESDETKTIASTALTDSEPYRTALYALFTKLHQDLAAIDGKLEIALSLGRALADTVYLPKTTAQLKDELKHWRLTNIYEWLNDLHQSLPDGAADAVSGSLHNWESYSTPLDPAADMEQIRARLHLQGKLWKQLLCGDKRVEDQLGPDDYESAAEQLISRFRALAGRFLSNHLLAASLFVVVVIGLVILILLSGADFNQKLIGFVVTALGAFGISWTAIKSSLGRTLSAIEKPLLAAEVKEAAKQACTILPDKKNQKTSTTPSLMK